MQNSCKTDSKNVQNRNYFHTSVFPHVTIDTCPSCRSLKQLFLEARQRRIWHFGSLLQNLLKTEGRQRLPHQKLGFVLSATHLPLSPLVWPSSHWSLHVMWSTRPPHTCPSILQTGVCPSWSTAGLPSQPFWASCFPQSVENREMFLPLSHSSQYLWRTNL